jgi:hypothetical protein
VDVNVLLHDIRTVDADAVAVGFFEDVRPLKGGAGALDWLLSGALSRLVIEDRVRGALGEVALLTTSGKMPASKVFLFGLGRRDALSPESLRRAARTAAERMTGAGVRRAAMDCFPLETAGNDALSAAVKQGLQEGAGAYPLSVSLLARDVASFEQMSRALKS